MKKNRLFSLLIILLLAYGCKNSQVAPTPGRDNHLALGNPSKAQTSNTDNYLLTKPQYVLSYNCATGTANWVSWHLSKAWKGTATRRDDFRPDETLPGGCYRVTKNDYTNTSFDRGHLCPSDDRDANAEDNSATFLMTNIIPQSPDLNRETWRILEEYSRILIEQGNELYIIAGAYGKGGSGTEGTRSTIAGGKVTVPARCWKVIVVLPEGSNDPERVSSSTRVIAVDMPNLQSVNNGKYWYDYRVSVDAIEEATGFDLLSELSSGLQSQLESKVDSERIQ